MHMNLYAYYFYQMQYMLINKMSDIYVFDAGIGHNFNWIERIRK